MMAHPHQPMLDQPAVAHTPRPARPAIRSLLALDARFGAIVASTSEPLIGQMRLAWWRNALIRLDEAPAPAEPLLGDLQAAVLPRGVSGGDLAAMVEGWEELLLAERLDPATLGRFAGARGATLFGAMAMVLDAHHPAIAAAGEGWALADVACRSRDGDAVVDARRSAAARFDVAFRARWPRAARPLGVMALIARSAISSDSSPIRHWLSLTKFTLAGR